jgi:hypothetical protein
MERTFPPPMYGGSVGRWRREMEELDAICAGRWHAPARESTPFADEEYVCLIVGELERHLTAQLEELRARIEGVESFLDAISDAVERLHRESCDS